MELFEFEINKEEFERKLDKKLEKEVHNLVRIKMLNTKEVAECLGTTVQTVGTTKDIGILKPIKIGKQFMYSQDMLLEFQKRYEGIHLSNVGEMKKAYKALG